MRSIRGALLGWLFVLMTGALAAFSFLAYESARAALVEKKQAQEVLLRKQMEDNCKEARARLDEVLTAQVRHIARNTRLRPFHTEGTAGQRPLTENEIISVFGAGLMDWPSSGAGILMAPCRPLMASESLLASLVRFLNTKIDFEESTLPRFFDEEGPTQYFQINWKDRDRTRGWPLSTQDQHLPFKTETAHVPPTTEPGELPPIQFDDIELASDLHLRRAYWTMPVFAWARAFSFFGQGQQRGRQGTGERPQPTEGAARLRPGGARPGQQRGPGQFGGTLTFQCAASTAVRDERIARIREDFENNLAGLEVKSQETLGTLRQKFLLVGLGTLAVAALACFSLVRTGLSPLQRLSVAVGRVSPRDFKLPFEEKRLPKELSPIVERLNETLGQLKRVFAREKQAAADISHELRTPIAALLTTIEVALKKGRSPEEYREVLRDCHATGQQISQLVERLLILARLDAGVDALRPREVDVAALTEQCTNMVRPLAEVKGLKLELDRNGPIVLRADPDKLREIVTNLLHNAIAYNKPSGKVAVTVRRNNGKLQLEVTDTGIGISPEAREHIFDRFYRADSSRHAEGLHAGLGLSIVKGYTDLMGGTVCVESVPGKGSTFRVELPLPSEQGAGEETRRVSSH